VSWESDIWAPDPDPAIAQAEAELTAVGSSFLYHVHQDLHAALGLPRLPGEVVAAAYHTDHLPTPLAKATPASRSGAWKSALALFDRVRGVSSLKAGLARTLARAVTERWYGTGLLESRAEQAGVRARLVGMLRAQGAPPGGLFPTSLEEATAQVVDPERREVIEQAKERALELVDGLKDSTRHLIAGELLDAQAERRTPQQTAGRLLDRFATLNRDWRRLAITEASMHRAHGFLSGLPEGETVEWFAAPDACPHCLKLHGRHFTVRHSPGDGEAEVWPGKSNAGRSFSPKDVDGRTRSPDELAWPTIPLHPHCRCRWLRIAPVPAGVSDRLEAYLAALSNL
jgi:hypothetical protein